MIYLYGKGSDITNQSSVQRRAKSKLINQKLMPKLADIAIEKGDQERAKAYWNTYYCQNKITTANGRLYATQCKNRFCTYCSGIRKADLINRYLPVVITWNEPYFVTLTIKAIAANKLEGRIKALNRAFRKIVGKYQKRGNRGKGNKLIGLKAIECNFNATYRTYNPHLHLIVPDKLTAKTLVDEWLKLWTPKHTHKDAQHFRKVEDKEKDLVEIIKYEAKIITGPDGKKKNRKKGSAKIYAKALDNIYAAMKGLRLIDRFGFNLPKNMERKSLKSQLVKDFRIWEYHSESMDWISEDHECTLATYCPSAELIQLLQHEIDIDKQ